MRRVNRNTGIDKEREIEIERDCEKKRVVVLMFYKLPVASSGMLINKRKIGKDDFLHTYMCLCFYYVF